MLLAKIKIDEVHQRHTEHRAVGIPTGHNRPTTNSFPARKARHPSTLTSACYHPLMMDPILTQSEADALLAMEKIRTDEHRHNFPGTGGRLMIPLHSRDKREPFILDVYRARIDLRRGTFQNRARQTLPLVRVDIGGSPHTNPDGVTIPCPHIHLYREGFGDKWAQPLPVELFDQPADPWEVLQSFFRYCRIVEPPHIEKGLFA